MPPTRTGKHSERRNKLSNTDEALAKMTALARAYTKTVGMLGARTMALGKFFDAVLPHLTAPQRIRARVSFRHGTEDAMAQTDDVPLLNITRRCLNSPMPSLAR